MPQFDFNQVVNCPTNMAHFVAFGIASAFLKAFLDDDDDALEEEIERRKAAERKAEEAAREAAEAAEAANRLEQQVRLEQRMRALWVAPFPPSLFLFFGVSEHRLSGADIYRIFLVYNSGFDPTRVISNEEIETAREELGCVQGCTNIAIVGFQNAGKSSLCNSLRGVRHSDAGAAKVEESETTMKHDAYPDAQHNGVVWHDLPGGGTQEIKAFNYYYNHKLFAFDKLLLVHTSKLTEVSSAIAGSSLSNLCRQTRRGLFWRVLSMDRH